MIAVIQRVSSATVRSTGKKPVKIGKGMVVLVGIDRGDTSAEAKKLGLKLVKLRIMGDKSGKLNLNLNTVDGELLLVSQFTLISVVGSGNRPSFSHAASGDKAIVLFDDLVAVCRQYLQRVKTGFFSVYSEVELINDGPVTLVLDSQKF